MNKYVAKASLMLVGNLMLWAFVTFLLYLFTVFAPVEFVLGIFFCLAAVVVVMFIATFVGIIKEWVIYKARELAKKDGIHA